jgi:F0F1-type ATP synthase membrane subunit b/b'
VFDNYTPSPAPPDVLPSPSCSRKNLADTEPVEESLSQELDELRQQLQYAKRQTLVMMEQSRKASEAEKIALQQSQEAMAAKEIAHSEAEKATTRENFMLELMNEASADMSGMLVASFV